MSEETVALQPIECPICHFQNPPGEKFCQDCGFLLGSEAGEWEEKEEKPQPLLISSDGKEYVLKEGENLVGRESADILLFYDKSVSRKHALIILEGDKCYVQDLGSTNGTFLNGVRLSPGVRTQIYDGDSISFGDSTFRFSYPPCRKEEIPAKAILILEGKEIPITKEEFLIGRREGDLIVPNPYVSGRHCKIYIEEGGAYIEDLGSTNGTFLNGKEIERGVRTALEDGAIIEIGGTKLVFRLPGEDRGKDREAEGG
jgi:pSer/pThr/pTyr-binding forkhead associated (FHA) protein